MRKNTKDRKKKYVGILLLALICVGGGLGVAGQGGFSTHSNRVNEQTAKAAASPAATKATATPKETEVPVSLKWSKKVASLKAGKSYAFKVKVNAGEPIKAVKWSVSNKKYATINQKGVLKGKRVGTVTVKAAYETVAISCKVKIKAKRIIGIDPGHQQSGNSGLEAVGPGASTKKVAGGTSGVSTHIAEYQLTMKIAKSLKKELVNRGYAVVMTRTKNNVNISNKERAIKINKSGADICIRLHADGGASSAKGASGLYPSSQNPYVGKLSSKSYKLSQSILKSYCAATGIRNRGSVKRDDLTGTNWSKVPVIVLEMGFMTNSAEDKYMASQNGQKAMVQGIANGVDSYYKK